MLKVTKLFYDNKTNRVIVNLFGTNMKRQIDEPNYFSTKGRYYFIKRREIMKLIRTYKAQEVVFNQGEPFCQTDLLDAITRYLSRNTKPKIKITLKTNGTLIPFCITRKINYIVEPLLHSSGKEQNTRLRKDILKIFKNRDTEWVFKPKTQEDIEDVERIKKWVGI